MVRVLVSIFALMVGASYAHAQARPPQAPAYDPAYRVTPAAPTAGPTYAQMQAQALKENKPLVVGVQCVPAVPNGYLSYQGRFDNETQGLILAVPYQGQLYRVPKELPAGASVLDVRRTVEAFLAQLESEVRQSPSPFDRSSATPFGRRTAEAADAATGPWLPESTQEYVKSMWPEGVPMPDTLKFYKLRPAGQNVAAFGSPGAGNHYMFETPGRGDTNPNREFPWVGSGGMDWAQKGTWRNVTGMALPEGRKIRWWFSPMGLNNGLGSIQYEWAIHWDFPVGTQMFDVLIRKHEDGGEHIFSVRRRVKDQSTETGWDNGVSFMPDVEPEKYDTYKTRGNDRSRSVLGVREINYRMGLVGSLLGKKLRFKETPSTLAINDGGHFFPPGFMGTGLSCNKCHNGAVQEAKTYGGTLLRGKDTVFSWHPVPEALVNATYTPTLDGRWPLEKVR